MAMRGKSRKRVKARRKSPLEKINSRRTLFEALEPRLLLHGGHDGHDDGTGFCAIFGEGTPPEYIDSFEDAKRDGTVPPGASGYRVGTDRWTNPATAPWRSSSRWWRPATRRT